MRTPSSLTNELDRELMNRASTLQSVLHSLGEHGEKIALLAITKRDQQRWSYRKLGNSARSFANGLIKAGFKSGDSIALFSENRPEWIAAALGVIRAGAVAVPLDIQLDDEDLAHILSDSEARAVITTRRLGSPTTTTTVWRPESSSTAP